MGKEKPQDLFMQFAAYSVVAHITDPQQLVSADFPTGLSIRGEFIWLMHLIEFSNWNPSIDNWGAMVLCAVPGLVALPDLNDRGVIARDVRYAHLNTNGGWANANPSRHSYLPPIPFASPNITLYAQMQVDEEGQQAVTLECRIGYTTLPVSKDVYLELAEVWEQVF